MSGDPYYEYVSLLMHMDGSDNGTTFTDQTGKTVSRAGNTVTKTGEKKFGTASVYFDGSGDYLTIASSTSLNMPADFTVEAWIYNTSSASAVKIINIKASGGYSLYLNASNKLAFAQDGVAELVVSTGAVPINEWVHVSASRAGNSLKLFINGVNDGQATNSTALNGSGSGYVGSGWTAGLYFTGYIDDLRVTKGIARYTANFDVPTAAFPDFPAPTTAVNRPRGINPFSQTINRIHYQRL